MFTVFLISNKTLLLVAELTKIHVSLLQAFLLTNVIWANKDVAQSVVKLMPPRAPLHNNKSLFSFMIIPYTVAITIA